MRSARGGGLESRPGTVRDAVSLPDGVQVTLDAVMVERVMGSYLFIRDPWPRCELLPVYAIISTSIPLQWRSVEVTGRTMTISGKRVVCATRVRLYTDSRGKPFPIIPKSPLARWEWPYLQDVLLGMEALWTIPPPPDPNTPLLDSITPPPVAKGTIAYAKIACGKMMLTGKVVTRAFREPETGVVQFFYIEEPDRTGGIKVEPDPWMADWLVVDPGYEVMVVGEVIPGDTSASGSDPECHIHATVVGVTGQKPVPAPLGLTGRATAAGEFGEQPALYPTPSGPGGGLNAVGSLVRIWGVRAEHDGTVYYVNDGSNLTRGEHTGLKVVFWEGPDPQLGEYINDLTGVLGAEMSEDDVPVPVVRVSCPSQRCVIRVNKNGGDDGNSGADWNDAMATIQAGIDAAAPNACEVWVAGADAEARGLDSDAGVYYERIELADGVAVYGGFKGDENAREQRDWPANLTVIADDGQSTDRLVKAYSGVTASARLDGFTVRGNAWCTYSGAGIYCEAASPTIANDVIAGNRAFYADGGGIACVSGAQPVIWNDTIMENDAYYGGGVYCAESSPTIVTSSILRNAAIGHGGGIHSATASPTILWSKIDGNVAIEGSGGGVFCHSTFGTGAVISNNTVTGNKASIVAGYGGGIMLTSGCNGTVIDNVIARNIAPNGGGLACVDASPLVRNNTVARNTGSLGGGIYLQDSWAALTNNIFAFNSSGIYRYEQSGSPSLRNNDVFNPGGANYSGLSAGAGDMSLDPLFVDRMHDDYHLFVDTSPCIKRATIRRRS